MTSATAEVTPAAQADHIEASLKKVGTRERATNEKRYLKSDLDFLGVRMPDIRRVVKDVLRDLPEFGRDELLELVVALWRKPVFERRMVATVLLEERIDLLQARDAKLVEQFLRESRTWALVDTLAPKVMGSLFERYESLGATLDRWAEDEDFWIRRSALLTLLVPLRTGAGDFERFGRYADSMLEEKEFFIRKAIGWILRETSKKRPDLVFKWLSPRAHRASGVTMREAVRYLSDEQAVVLTAAYKRNR